MTKFLSFHFSSAHFYQQEAWSKEKNQEVFGACFNPFGHGHNYRLELGVELSTSDSLVQAGIAPILKSLDHHHLNFEIEEFKTKVPTTENIALFIAEKIKSSIPGLKVIRLYEAPDLWAELELA